MIGMQEQFRSITKRRIGRPPFGIGMAMWADDRQASDVGI